MKPKYNIGDAVWWARTDTEERYITCQDCQGQKFLTVIMGDGSQVTIDCSLCSKGYEPPRGFKTYSEHVAYPILTHITRMEITGDGIEYGVSGSYRVDENKLFLTKEEAEPLSARLAQEHTELELKRIQSKESEHRTWAWNVRYHRECIRRAQRELIYHTAKLEVAKVKAKEK